MDANNAINLINETFHNKFNLNQYQKFLRELFNISNVSVKNLTKYIKNEFVEYTNSVLELGHYTDDLGDSIVFYVIELAKESSRDRARTMQRNLVSTFMRDEYDYALVAFYEPNTGDWRFSYVKIEYEFNEKGLKEKLSSPKRHSFLVGPNEPNHTCRKQILPLMISENKFEISEIDDVFNIENVTIEFFNEYKRLFLDLTDSLNDVKSKDREVHDEFENKKIESSDFAKKLMGQLVFVYFLQKKGWLGCNYDEEWGKGPKNFLRKLFDKNYGDYKNFFNDILEPLFYQGFCEPVMDYHFSQFKFKVPFLNGGLFEPMNNYDWIRTDLTLEDSIFKEILDTFDKFNFTIKEDEPLEKEVAVDPEMLGKVFENLLEVKDRKSMGAFYTPRNIVHQMCQESLISYLNNNLNIPKEDISIFIKKGDNAVNSIIRVNEEKKKYDGRQYSKILLPESIMSNSKEIDKLLENVKIIDPAVGSGAFPVGMMNEIVKARQILLLLSSWDDINFYELKKDTIEKSLYCIDIDYSATEITKLRFWLSLVVDEDSIDSIRPLPNLDNHVICGNSLVDSFKGIKLFDEDLINANVQTTLTTKNSEIEFLKLEKKKQEYFNEKSPLDKLRLKSEIENIKWNFIFETLKESGNKEKIEEISEFREVTSKPFTLWELEFSEIFPKDNYGFDIVIGNPPYVSWSDIDDREIFEEGHYLDLKYKCRPNHKDAQPNLYMFFLVKSLYSLKNNGCLSFIIPQEWLYVVNDFRDYFLDNTGNISIFKFHPEYKVFKNDYEEIGTNSLILLFEKNNGDEFLLCELDECEDKGVNSFLDKYSMFPSNIYNFNDYNVKIKSLSKKLLYDTRWQFYHYIVENILSNVDDNFIFLNNKSFFNVFGGFQPNVDLSKQFIIKKGDINRLNKLEKDCVFPCIYKASNIQQYYLKEEGDYWIIVNKLFKNEEDFKTDCPNLFNYLYLKLDTSKKKWWEFPNPRNLDKYKSSNEKLLSPRTASINSFAYDNNKHIIKGTNTAIISKKMNLKYVLGILNSSLASFYYKEYGFSYHGSSMKYEPANINSFMIPIKKADLAVEKEIVNLVDSILTKRINDEDTTEETKKIDSIVYQLYGLTDEEITLVETSI